MRGSSADSFARLSQQQRETIAAGADASRLADDLFGTATLLRGQPALRRAVTDPSTEFASRTALARELLAAHLCAAATDIVGAAAGMRWASAFDLVRSLERLGVIAVARAADNAGEADRLESELFQVGQLIGVHPEIREALTDGTRSMADKVGMLTGLLEGHVCDGTIRLIREALSGSHSTVRAAFDDYARIATEARGRLLAVVRIAHPLAEKDSDRLAAVLSRQYGKQVHLNVVLDQGAVGGIQVEIGDEIIDGTIASRLSDAGRRLAG